MSMLEFKKKTQHKWAYIEISENVELLPRYLKLDAIMKEFSNEWVSVFTLPFNFLFWS